MHAWDDPLPLFVYGTLLRGGVNHDAHCAGLVRALPARTRGTLYHLAAGYPALATDGRGAVHGELLTFADQTAAVARIDALEDARPGGDGQYLRVAVPVDLDGGIITAWTYVYDEPRLRLEPDAVLVAGGRWTPRT